MRCRSWGVAAAELPLGTLRAGAARSFAGFGVQPYQNCRKKCIFGPPKRRRTLWMPASGRANPSRRPPRFVRRGIPPADFALDRNVGERCSERRDATRVRQGGGASAAGPVCPSPVCPSPVCRRSVPVCAGPSSRSSTDPVRPGPGSAGGGAKCEQFDLKGNKRQWMR